MKTKYKTKIERGREKLNKMVDEALESVTPILNNREITKQSRKVNEMIIKNEGGGKR